METEKKCSKKILLSKSESVKIYWLSVKFDWFKWLKRGYCKSVECYWLLQWKSTDLTVEDIFSLIQSVKINWFDSEKLFCTDESVKMQITGSIGENLTNSDLESREISKYSTENNKDFFPYKFFCIFRISRDDKS